MRASKALFVSTVALAVVVAVPSTLRGQIDLTGTWSLEMEAELPPQEPTATAVQPKGVAQAETCLYSGTVVATQDGQQWTGPAELFLLSGPADCPAEMTGDLTGTLTVEGDTTFIDGFIDGGDPTGSASFSGTISPNPGGDGAMSVTGGPFDGSSGTWSAALQLSVLEIPVVTPVGMTLLALLLLGGGTWFLSRATPA